jgi:hypothetical protein
MACLRRGLTPAAFGLDGEDAAAVGDLLAAMVRADDDAKQDAEIRAELRRMVDGGA